MSIAWLALPIIVITGYLIVKKYQTQMVLLVSGLTMVALAVAAGNTGFLPKGFSSTGFIGFDVFELIRAVMASRAGEISLLIMSAGGFAAYMNHIGAAEALVNLSTRPLKLFKSPYLVLALAYLVGQIINIVVPSAAGLAMLLLVAMYPTLVRLGVSRAAAATVIGTASCLDLGPASGTANVAAKAAHLDPIIFFTHHQLLPAAIAMVVIAVLHYFVQRHFDAKCGPADMGELEETRLDVPRKQAPALYSLLPVIPLVMLIVFSKLIVSGIKLDVITAMFMGMFLGVLCEAVRYGNIKQAFAGVTSFFKGMGNMFTSIITLLVAAEVFASGLKTIGFIDLLLQGTTAGGHGVLIMMTVLIAIMGITGFMTGSGVAAFYSFAGLAPEVSAGLGVPATVMLVPMQLSTGMFRSMSPVAGVVIAVAGAAGVSPLEVAKRSAIPMLGGIITLVVSTLLLRAF